MKERDKEMTKTIKHIVTSFLPSLREGLGVGFLLLLGGVGVGLLSSCSDNPALEQADDRVQLNLNVVETGWHGETFGVSTRSGETLEGLRSVGAARSWNFASIPAEDITALGAASSLWSYNDGTKTYTNTTAVNNTLKGGTAGTTELKMTEDLRFSAAVGGIHIVNNGTDNCIRFTGTLIVSNLKAGQTVTVVVKSLADPGPPITITNVDGSPVIPASATQTTETRTVAVNGSVSFTASAPVNIYSISVSKAEDDGFGLYCTGLSMTNTQVTWDNTNGKWKIGNGYDTYWRRNVSGTLDIYAYAPYKATSTYPVTDDGKLTYQAGMHNVPGYTDRLSGNNVDLLYASNMDFDRKNTGPAILTFKHALAKITFGTITNNTGGPLNINGYTIRGTMYNSATLDLTNGEWSGHVTNAVGSVALPPPFAPSSASPLADKETILPPMPNRELTFIPGPDPGIPGSGPGGTLPLTIEVNSSTTNETFSFDVTLEQGKNKTYNIIIGENHEVVIVEE